MTQPQTLFEKIWSRHVVTQRPDGFTLLYIDRHLIHDGSMAAFARLKAQGQKVRCPHKSFATPDHYVPTNSRNPADIAEPNWRKHVETIKTNTQAHGIALFHIDDPRQGIVHVMGPEQGITLPGITLVCGDSHTATHGAMGAIAFGIGSSEVTHVLATQTVWQKKPKTMRISVDGTLGLGVTAKDVIIAIIAKMGAAGATGHAVEFAGGAIRGLSIEGRLTLCNMTIEGGGRSGTVAPDDKTYQYLHGRPYAPKGPEWDEAVAFCTWLITLRSCSIV